MPYRLSFAPPARTWIATHPDLVLVVRVVDWCKDELCARPHDFPEFADLPGQAYPRNVAPVPDTDVIVTYAVSDELEEVRVLKIENEPRQLWTPSS